MGGCLSNPPARTPWERISAGDQAGSRSTGYSNAVTMIVTTASANASKPVAIVPENQLKAVAIVPGNQEENGDEKEDRCGYVGERPLAFDAYVFLLLSIVGVV
jgi:hypothetical protein